MTDGLINMSDDYKLLNLGGINILSGKCQSDVMGEFVLECLYDPTGGKRSYAVRLIVCLTLSSLKIVKKFAIEIHDPEEVHENFA